MSRGVKRHRMSGPQVDDLIGLRKQVADLKEAASARKRVEDALRRSEAWYRGLVERCPIGLGEIDANGYLRFANNAFAQSLGYPSKAELLNLGTGITVFGGPDERERALGALRQGAEGRQFEAVLRTRIGGSCSFGITACTAETGEGTGGGFILVLSGPVAPLPGLDLDSDVGLLQARAQNGGA